MDTHPLISVIVPTFQRDDLLAECLDRLAPGAQTLGAERYEVIVTDDGRTSTAEAMIRARYPWAKWMAGPRRGPAANRNNGARFARGAWLAFTDDDCLPDPHWLERYAEAMDGEASALEGAIHPLGDWGDLTECPVNLSGGCFWSANIAVRCSTFWQCEGFDENYPLAAHEDQDLQLRLSALTTIRFVADAIVTHPVRPLSFRGAIARIPGRCRVWAFHFHKHRRTLGFASNLSIVLFGCNVHGRLVIEHLLSLHFRSAFVNVLMVLYGAPVMWVHLERLSGAGASEAVAG